MDQEVTNLEQAHVKALVRQCAIKAGTDTGDRFMKLANEAGLIQVSDSAPEFVWEESIAGWNGAVARRCARTSNAPPIPLAVRYDFAGHLFSRTCELWYSLITLPDSVPASAREIISSEALTAGATAMAFAQGLEINAEGYPITTDDDDRARLYYDLAQRAWTISGALEYKVVRFDQIKLPR